MEIRGVALWAAPTLRNRLVRRDLNEVSRDEACRDSQMAKNLHQQPCGVTARPGALFKSLLACLDSRVQPRYVTDFVSYPSIQVDQKSDRSALLDGNVLKKSSQQRAGRLDRTIGFEIPGQLRRVLERVLFDSWFQKEIEGIEARQLGNKVHLNHKLGRLVLKKDAREMIVVDV